MVSPVTLKADLGAFKASLDRYLQHTKKDLAQVMNDKGFFIARRALRETPKADKQKILSELGMEAKKPTK